MNHDILGFLNKSKTPDRCGFPLANLQSAESIYCVPYGASALNPLKVFKILA